MISCLNHALARGTVKNHVVDDLFLAISLKCLPESHLISFTPASVALGVSEKLSKLWIGRLIPQDNNAKLQDSYPYDKQNRSGYTISFSKCIKKEKKPPGTVHC